MDGKPPERIWLQWADEGDYESYDDLEGVTWCVDSINETDVEYVPAARIAELEAANERQRKALCSIPRYIVTYHLPDESAALVRSALSGAEEEA